MAWITPITDRPNEFTRTTAEDMNRIAGNINHLLGTNLKDDYVDTDIVTVNAWRRIIEETSKLNHFGLKITSKTDYVNLNNIEKVALYKSYVEPLRLSFGLAQPLGVNLFKSKSKYDLG